MKGRIFVKKLLSVMLALAMLFTMLPTAYSVEAQPQSEELVHYKFDFGGLGTAEGYIGLSAKDGVYSKDKGYGFADLKAVQNVTSSGKDELSDAVQFLSNVPNHYLKVDLPNGYYKITVVTGDVVSTSITAEGTSQLFFLTGNNATDSFTIPVTDGQLQIYPSSGISGTPFSLSTLEIEQIPEQSLKPTIWLAGDSTVSKRYNVTEDSERGWGEFLYKYIDTEEYDIRNIGINSIDSTQLKNAAFPTAVQYAREGDILLLSIGINDYRDAVAVNSNSPDPTEYVENMRDMVRQAKEKGMRVYLVTQQGEDDDCLTYPIIKEKWFNSELNYIARVENVSVIDVFNPWLEFCLESEWALAVTYYCNPIFLNARGADKVAKIVADQLFAEPVIEEPKEDPYENFDTPNTIYYETEVFGGPVKNPHKGFVNTVYGPNMLIEGEHPYGIGGLYGNCSWDVVTIVSDVLFWEDLSTAPGEYDFTAIDEVLEACEEQGMTYGIRIFPYASTKGSDDNYGAEHDFVPEWVYTKYNVGKDLTYYKYDNEDTSVPLLIPRWSDSGYTDAYIDFVTALAEKYNGDPRVEYFSICSYGNYGEWHTTEWVDNPMPSVEDQKRLLDHVAKVFDKTTCCVISSVKGEVYEYALSLGITKRNDSFIRTRNAEWDLRPAYRANLPTLAENLGPYSMQMEPPTGNFLQWTEQRFRETIEIAHLSIYALDQESTGSFKFYKERQYIIDEMCNRLGYNFTVTEAKRDGNKLLVTIKNTGVAPAFFNIDLCAEITDNDGNKLEAFGQPIKIEKGSFRDDSEQTFLFEYKGNTNLDNAIICLAMYDCDNYISMAKPDPTVRFDNKNTLVTNRLRLTDLPEHTPSDVASFKGGSLRIQKQYSRADIRFRYVIDEKLPEGAEIISWHWKYGTTEGELPYYVKGENIEVVNGKKISNIIFTNIKAENYGDNLYTQLTVDYKLNGVKYTVVDDVVCQRSIHQIATAVVDDKNATTSAKNYAQGLLDYYNKNVK